MRKRIGLVGLAVVLTLLMSACGNEETGGEEGGAEQSRKLLWKPGARRAPVLRR